MGEIVKMVCGKCGHGWQCRTGCGVTHARLDSVIPFFNEETQNNILRQTEKQKIPLFSFEYKPAYCYRCSDIVSVPVLQLIKEDASYIGECPKCSTTIEAEYLKEKLVCPICEGRDFDVIREGLWD